MTQHSFDGAEQYTPSPFWSSPHQIPLPVLVHPASAPASFDVPLEPLELLVAPDDDDVDELEVLVDPPALAPELDAPPELEAEPGSVPSEDAAGTPKSSESVEPLHAATTAIDERMATIEVKEAFMRVHEL